MENITKKVQQQEKQTGRRKRSRENQINVKLSDDLYARLKAAAELQRHTPAKLARILVEWALPFYEHVQSVATLHKFDFEQAQRKCPEAFGNSQTGGKLK